VAPFSLLALLAIMAGVVAGVVTITLAARRIAIQIPQRTMARGRQREAARNFIPIRINSAGVMPIIFAQSVIVVPGRGAVLGQPRLQDMADYLTPGTWLYYVPSAVLIVFFTYFYTSIIFNPVDLAENLKKQGGFIPGIKPGAKTAEHIDGVVERITLPGALFLTASRSSRSSSPKRSRAVPVRRHLAPDRGRRGARYDGADAAAPPAAQVRRLHEEGARPLPRTQCGFCRAF
jgi:preprotein translocase subunit SecY